MQVLADILGGMCASSGPAVLDCSVFGAVETIGDAWSWMVLSEAIVDGISRFDGFQRRLGIARSTLSARLSGLCANGLMERHGQEYRLTEMGDDFLACIMTATAWGERWCHDAGEAQVRASHRGCADRIHGELRCGECRALAHARDVSFDRRPRAMAELPLRRQRTPDLELLQRVCPSSVAATLQVTGDRWSALLIRESFYGSTRFDEFQQRLSIATNILTQRLRRLVDLGILTRTAYRQRPARHEYRLTKKGLDLYPVPLSMLAWGDRWVFTGQPPVRLTHQKCRRPLTPILTCSACAESISRADIVFSTSAPHSSETRKLLQVHEGHR
jgi:DNA-binding HxlR family transcriptional regulator